MGPVVMGVPATEKQAEQAVIELFRLYGWEVNVMREDIHVGAKGIPDLMCVSPHGLILHIEMKRPASSRNPKGRVRKAQRERLIEWRRREVPCCVVDSVDDAMRLIRAASLTWGMLLAACDDIMSEYPWWPA